MASNLSKRLFKYLLIDQNRPITKLYCEVHFFFIFIEESYDKVHLGCGKTLAEKDVGCQSIVKPCNPVVLLQLSTKSKAKQCFCNENGCNNYTNLFRTIIGGYLVVVIGTIGIIGNCLTLGVLVRTKEKKDIYIILIGKKHRTFFRNGILLHSPQNFLGLLLILVHKSPLVK